MSAEGRRHRHDPAVQRRRQNRRGAAALELALVLPLVLGLIVGGIEVASMSRQRQHVYETMRAAAVASGHGDAGPAADAQLVRAVAAVGGENVSVARILLFDPQAPTATVQRCVRRTLRRLDAPPVCTVIVAPNPDRFVGSETEQWPTTTCDGTPFENFCSLHVAKRANPQIGLDVQIRVESRLATGLWPLSSTASQRLVLPVARGNR